MRLFFLSLIAVLLIAALVIGVLLLLGFSWVSGPSWVGRVVAPAEVSLPRLPDLPDLPGLPGWLGWGDAPAPAEPAVSPAAPLPTALPLPTAAVRAAPPGLLTREARELRRIRDEHAALIASIPPTPEPTPTLTAAERSVVVSARVRQHPEGVPVPLPVGEDWFVPSLGLDFYRDFGGDWTAEWVRENHSHRDLFYYADYPKSLANFSDGSIYRLLAREMLFEAVSVLPFLGEPTPAMMDAFSRDLGWELRDSSQPTVNLWTTFTVRREGQFYIYAVGGVMLMGVSSSGDNEDDLMEYVTPGRWIGPVVVERPGHGYVGDIGRPDLVYSIDRHSLQQVWVDLVLWCGLAGVGAPVDGFQTH